MRKLVPGAPGAAVMYSAERGAAWYRHVHVCKSVWACPVCAERIAAVRRDELAAALVAAARLGLTPVLVTLTVQHQRGDTLPDLLADLLKSIRALKAVRGWKELREEYDWRGDIRNLEPTYGLNGWHPHCHFLVFLGRKLTGPQVSGLRQWITELWLHQLRKNGRNGSFDHAVDVRTADADIADYVAKFGRQPEGHWGAAEELTRGPVKRGHRDGLTPWQLLDLYGRESDDEKVLEAKPIVRSPKQAGALFVEYVEAFGTRSQLQWSRGLRAMLAMEDDKPDEELPDELPGDAVQVALIEPVTWSRLVRHELHGELLDVCAEYGMDGLRAWLARFGIGHVDLSQFDMPPPRGSPARQ